MAKQRHIKIYQYGLNSTQLPEYEGRLLGVVDDKTFSIAKKDKEIAEKLLNVETVRLDDAITAFKTLDLNRDGARLAVGLRAKNDKTSPYGTLFFTPRLSTLNSYAKKGVASMNIANSQQWLRVEEQEGD